MDSILVVSSTEKSIAFILDMLCQNSYKEITTMQTCSEARAVLKERCYDLCIINAPLCDESGENFSREIVSKGISQVILIVNSEIFEKVSQKVEDIGVFTLSKPISKSIFSSALKLANASYNKMALLQVENQKLSQKLEDLRLIDRAKCTLIQYLSMTESEAHKYIERQAMDLRVTKKTIAHNILKTYES
jgi:AmiR/NasT family two-component response regulator